MLYQVFMVRNLCTLQQLEGQEIFILSQPGRKAFSFRSGHSDDGIVRLTRHPPTIGRLMNEAIDNLQPTPWEKAWEAVRAFLPAATYMTPASLLAAANRQGMQVNRLNFMFSPDEEDASILRKVVAMGKSDEPVIVVTDHCFHESQTPYIVRSSSTDSFAESYRKHTDECVISGLDVVFIFPESKFLVLFYHEGDISMVS